MEENSKICKYCKEQIAKKAKRCPKCGGKLGIPGGIKALILLIIMSACIFSCTNGCSNAVDKAIEDTKDSYKDINGKTSFKINETFKNKYEKITMTEINLNFTDYNQYLPPSNGNKYVMLKFEIENINSENDELYISSLNFNGYADGIAVKSSYIGNDTYNDLSATIGKGKKAIGYVFYEIPLNANKITVEYNPSYWSDGNIIEFVVQ